MAHIIKVENKLSLSIFVILFPTENSFFLSKTPEGTLRKRYEDHYYCSRAKTKKLFASARARDELPPMYCLETLETTEKKAFNHCIAWAKYFIEHGMKSCCGDHIDRYVNDLNEDSQRIYNTIRNKDIDEVCPQNQDLFPKFGRVKTKNDGAKSNRVNIRMGPEEYQKIKNAAENVSMTMSEYCRDKVLNGRVINVDPAVFELLSSFVNEFVTRDQLLKNILAAIYKTRTYYPADLQIIQEAIEDNSKQQAEALDAVKNILKQLMD